MKVLSLDFGLKRIGVAIADTKAGIAFPRLVILNTKAVFDELVHLIHEEKIDRILVGMPYKRDNSVGDIDEQLQEFVRRLQELLKIPVDLIDERYTTKLAEQKLADVKKHVRFKYVDSIAAQIILQEWLEKKDEGL